MYSMAHDWLTSYLEDRLVLFIVIIMNNQNSSRLNVTCGLPQGSVLGPLLFILYICLVSMSLKCMLFADDILYWGACKTTSGYSGEQRIRRFYAIYQVWV